MYKLNVLLDTVMVYDVINILSVVYVCDISIRHNSNIWHSETPRHTNYNTSHRQGLIVDQTIEKVSFCAPDRNHEKGFAYICRDGTTRRWMCHGFLAIKETVSVSAPSLTTHTVAHWTRVCHGSARLDDDHLVINAAGEMNHFPNTVLKRSVNCSQTHRRPVSG